SARKKLKQLGSRENRYVTDVNHQVTKALVDKYPRGTMFVLEDLTGVRS
ncbi:transposase, partial [Caldifermentibacillus hisashii]|nr:transposase [Caldifermentibacillus hisashii]